MGEGNKYNNKGKTSLYYGDNEKSWILNSTEFHEID